MDLSVSFQFAIFLDLTVWRSAFKERRESQDAEKAEQNRANLKI